MLNTEIGKTGEVIVEGHVIGRLDGFTFAPDAAEAGSDAKALQATAQKALAGEIDARAEKLAAAPDDQFVLASDGTIRWTGDAVAKLTAAEDALHPRVRIISDDRLNGAAREAVQTRLDLWLKTHIEKLLAPLFELNKAEDITGIARGIAFQLIEALGVLERSKIAAEMKDLDQPSRASLRKYGVRFGAYHIYLPALLKPAARALASLLWALKQDNVDMSALSGAQHLAGSGRTSFPVDKQLDRDAYRVLGYRQCGERAVRVDILERLADLIRPALAWRESSPGEKPAGAFDGRSFVITQAMTSLTGSAGEDFASILRALGYRMERRPAPPPKPAVVEPPAEAAPAEVAATGVAPAEVAPAEVASEALSEAAAIEAAAAGGDLVAEDTPVGSGDIEPASPDAPQGDAPQASVDPSGEQIAASSATLLPGVSFVPVAAEPATPDVPQQQATAEAPADAVAPSEASSPEITSGDGASSDITSSAAVASDAAETPSDTTATDAAGADAPAAVVAKAAAPEMIEVWRPAGRSEDRRPRHDRNRHRHHGAPEGGSPATAAGEAGDAAKTDRPGRRRRHNEFRKTHPDAPAEGATSAVAEGAPAREPRGDERPHQPRERFQRDKDKPKFGGGRDKGPRDKGGRDKGGRDKGGRDKRPDGGPSHRQYATSASPRERDRPIDPNSPFAKLAALKEQLTAGRKD